MKNLKRGDYLEEVWKDIEGYEGYYIISNFGRVKSLDRYIERIDGKSNFVKGRFIAIQYNKRNNVYMVMLNKNGKRTAFNLHQLVARNFIPNDDPIHKTTINHIDGDKTNCELINLATIEELVECYQEKQAQLKSSKDV